jgi:tRNA(Ile2)-agmatinylcytidine synthase
VHSLVDLKDTLSFLKNHAYWYSEYKNNRGLIGATAAVAWRPVRDFTYELISYREEQRWGTPREVDEASVQFMDQHTKYTFDNYDYEQKHNRIIPSSPCPLLFGIRGEDTQELFTAKDMIISESWEGWLLFQTNQGTDDHLQQCSISSVKPYLSVQVKGTIHTHPRTLQGGHVVFSLKDDTGIIDCAAYEPTKEFRSIIRKLHSGDTVEICGGVRKKPVTVNIEKIHIVKLTQVEKKVENPVCPKCGKHMKSKGTNQGYKCVNCKTTAQEPVIARQQRELKSGWYEVPVCARRHLSTPLKRMNQNSFQRNRINSVI